MANPQKTLLLVDDTKTIRMLTRALLGPEYSYVEASDGGEGFYMARQNKPDLILMDLHMPSVDGIEGLRRLKADERTAAIPVIMLTTETDFLKRSQCRALGCVEFLNKPIGKDALGSAIRRWLVK